MEYMEEYSCLKFVLRGSPEHVNAGLQHSSYLYFK
jgi:hypothetical protein